MSEGTQMIHLDGLDAQEGSVTASGDGVLSVSLDGNDQIEVNVERCTDTGDGLSVFLWPDQALRLAKALQKSVEILENVRKFKHENRADNSPETEENGEANEDILERK